VLYRYQGREPIGKIFVCVAHEQLKGDWFAICMKATSQTLLYENHTAMMAGVVYYPKHSLSFFPESTAIQPDNPHPIAHSQLAACHAQGTLTILGAMPPDFPSRLTAAITGSITLSAERKQNYLQRI
jgi:hypothetical protein